MKIFRKNWILIIVSLFLGGAVSEVIHISTGDPNRPMTTNLTMLYALIIFGLLKLMIKLSDKERIE
jgi:hypothetical protein